MAQSIKKSREKTAFLYARLSRDDDNDGESYSVSNQKQLLTKVAKEKGYTNIITFVDDGISGVKMNNRPALQNMLEEIKKNKTSAVFVKDMSRLGRNYIEVGQLTEEFFPEHNIRLVSVADNLDSDEGESELTPIRNLFNEWYSRDISKKKRISNTIRGMAGEPLGLPPYGYIKNPENPKQWIIDEEASIVVKKIFSLFLDGLGTRQIASKLTEEKILTPSLYGEKIGTSKA
ncbi:MAG: recombinase family protein, partial [Clostridia bacterium]